MSLGLPLSLLGSPAMPRRSSSPAVLLAGLGVLVLLGLGALLWTGAPDAAGAGDAEADVPRAGTQDERGMAPPDPVAPEQNISALAGESSDPALAVREASAPRASWQLSGRLLRRSDRSPLARANVTGQQASTLTDEAGLFTLGNLRPGERTLWFTWDGRRIALELPEESERDGRCELLADTGWQVEGSVLDGTGAALSGAALSARSAARGTLLTGTLSDAAGHFVLRDLWPPGLPADEPTPSVREDAGVATGSAGWSVSVQALAEWNEPGRVLLELSADSRRVRDVVLRLPPAGAVAGVVRDAGGRPLPGVHLELPWSEERGWVEDVPLGLGAVSDGEGRYRIGGVPAGGYLALARDEHRRVLSIGASGGVQVGQTTYLDWTLGDAVQLAGSVLDGSGRPVAGADVRARLEWRLPAQGRLGSWQVRLSAEGLDARCESRSDEAGAKQSLVSLVVGRALSAEDGSYVLIGLPAGALRLTAASEPQQDLSPSERQVEPVAGSSLSGLDLVLGAGLSLRGQVLDERGQPLPGAGVLPVASGDVLGFDAQDFTGVDDEGRFALHGLGPEAFQLLVRCPGHRDWLGQVRPGDDPLEVTLSSAPVLAGVVLDGSLRPLTRYHLRVEDESRFLEADWNAPDGRFLIDSLEQGVYELTVTAPGFAEELVTDIRLVSGQPVELRVVMRRG